MDGRRAADRSQFPGKPENDFCQQKVFIETFGMLGKTPSRTCSSAPPSVAVWATSFWKRPYDLSFLSVSHT